MKILIDMNLSPEWCAVLERRGHEAMHWSRIGRPGATDAEVMAWAYEHGCVVLTHDLDFGAILAATQARGPSVIQVRTQDVLPRSLEPMLIAAIEEAKGELAAGAVVVVDASRARVRILPLSRP